MLGSFLSVIGVLVGLVLTGCVIAWIEHNFFDLHQHLFPCEKRA